MRVVIAFLAATLASEVAAQSYPALPFWEIPSLDVSTVANGTDFGSSSSVTDRNGYTYYVDTPNHTIMVLPPVGPPYVFSGVPGSPGGDLGGGPGNPPKFNRPTGLALDTQGFLYVADSDNGTIRRFLTRYYAYPVAGRNRSLLQRVDACGESARFYLPTSIKIEADGTIFIWDSGVLRRATVHEVAIVRQPEDVSIRPGESATLTTEITTVRNAGTPYRWFVGDDRDGPEFHELLGAGWDGVLSVSPVTTTNYWAVLFDGCSRTATRLVTVSVRAGSRRRAVSH